MVRRGSYTREIYGACLRTLAEAEDRNVPALLKRALAADDAGGNATLSAACFCKDPSLAAPLAKLAASRQSHLAFGAETARVCRRESNGAHLTAIAPMIKESHRIALCVELFVPLARSAPVPVHVGPALARASWRRAAPRSLARPRGRRGEGRRHAARSRRPMPRRRSVRRAHARRGRSSPGRSPRRARVTPRSCRQRRSRRHESAPRRRRAPRSSSSRASRIVRAPIATRRSSSAWRSARAASCKPMLEGLAKGGPLARSPTRSPSAPPRIWRAITAART